MVQLIQDKSITSGDSCNTHMLTFPNHAGTHVDVPVHFIDNAKSVEQYPPAAWFFNTPQIIRFSVAPGQLIRIEDLGLSENLDRDADIILFRSGFEACRGQDVYWEDGPGLDPELAEYVIKTCPRLRAVGMDFLSVSSLKHREQGRMVHNAFLEREIFLFEDMSLRHLGAGDNLARVLALPLRFTGGDGAPCTIIGFRYLD